MKIQQFTAEEFTPFIMIVCVIVFTLLYNYKQGYLEFWSPLTIVMVVYFYYCCIGPYEAVISGGTFDRFQNMRRYYPSAFWGAFISLLSFMAGYYFRGRSGQFKIVPSIPIESLFSFGKKIYFIGFILFTISTGGNVGKLINPLDAENVAQASGSFANYLSLSLNFIIPGIVMIFLYFVTTGKKFVWFIVPFAVAMGIFVTLGFRYRIVLLLASMAIVYFQAKKRRPNPVLLIGGFALIVALMGIINLTRTYGSGLRIDRLEGKSTENFYQSGLEEAMIFQTSGAVIDVVPKRYPHVGWTPVVSAILFPLPSALFKGKNSGEYLFKILDVIYGKQYSKGAAMMSYGEYYLAFGWPGIMIGFFLLGLLFRSLWNWFKVNSKNPLVGVAYAVSVTYLYVALSRGYLPQVVMLFFFTAFPVYVIIYLVKKRQRNSSFIRKSPA
jgi:oligosaccharide repeat unit polymerase